MALETSWRGEYAGTAFDQGIVQVAQYRCRQPLAVMLAHDWFGCKQIKLTGGAGHRQEDHSFGEWPKVGRSRLEWIGGLYRFAFIISSGVITKQVGQRARSDPSRPLLQEMAPRDVVRWQMLGHVEGHSRVINSCRFNSTLASPTHAAASRDAVSFRTILSVR